MLKWASMTHSGSFCAILRERTTLRSPQSNDARRLIQEQLNHRDELILSEWLSEEDRFPEALRQRPAPIAADEGRGDLTSTATVARVKNPTGFEERPTVPRYTPLGMDGVKECLKDCRPDTKVEVEHGVLVDAKTVADLLSLWAWPPGLVLVVNIDPDPRPSVVKVERAS